jgi:hypothetical protein
MIIKLAIALAIVLIVAASAAWAFLPARYLPGNRARHLRIRLHLRLHPGKGFAHVFSLHLRWGRLAALPCAARPGSARPSRSATGCWTPASTRCSWAALTTGTACGSHWRSTYGCQDPATAIGRADAFAFAVSQKGVEDGTFWSAKASDYLRGYFHAAALAGHDLRAVAAWVSGADLEVPEQILAAAGARQWALTLAELRSEAHTTAATVRMVMSRALSFMADPALAASVLPGPGRWGDHGRQVVLDTSSVKVFLPGITDTTTLEAASTLCGQGAWKVRGQDHATRHDVATRT